MLENKDYLEREKEIHDTWALENDYKLAGLPLNSLEEGNHLLLIYFSPKLIYIYVLRNLLNQLIKLYYC